MRCLVTGAAGFVGSHLCERLLSLGNEVVGVDAFTDYYPRAAKEQNLSHSRQHAGFTFIEADLVDADLAELLLDVEVVYHLAAQPGVRASWGAAFSSYVSNNVLATQRLLEACATREIRKFVYASSSSIYGDAAEMPVRETALPRPLSPYGVTKLAGEHLVMAYHKGYGMPTIALRYFTVYGPRQRPDMAFQRWIMALLTGSPITIYGDGRQTRDFTFVGDVVAATIRAGECPHAGVPINIAGGSRLDMLQVIRMMEDLSGKRARLKRAEAQKGDARDTWADTTAARDLLGFVATVGIREGLREQISYLKERLGET